MELFRGLGLTWDMLSQFGSIGDCLGFIEKLYKTSKCVVVVLDKL